MTSRGAAPPTTPWGLPGRCSSAAPTTAAQSFFAATAAFSQSKADVTFNKQDAANASFTTIAGATFWTSGSAQPWILADPARPGNIYVIAANRTHIPGGPPDPNDPADVVFTRSTDGGVTWSSPTIVDEGITVPGTTHNSFQLFPTAAIDQNGNIVVAWYDNRRGLTNSGGDYKLDVFARYSTDSGDTWSDAFQVNTTPFDPDPGAQTRFAGPPATTRIGEYFGIAMSNGMAYVDWNDNIFDNTGKATGQQVYLAAFQINGTLEVDQPNDVFRHKLTIDQLPGAPGNNFLEILDTTLSSPATTQRVYLGMGDFLGSLTVNDASHASDVIDIEKTFFGDNVHVNFTAQGGTVGVCLGNQDLDNIAGNIDIFSGFGFGSALAVNDALDPNPGDAWTLSFQNVSRFGSANIHYDGMDSFSVRGGDQGAKFDVETTTSATATSLTTGLGADEVDVRATSGAAPLSIDNAGGADTVTIGSLAPATGGTLAGIQSPVTVTSSGGSSHLILDDSGDATGETVTAGPGTITGLAPAEIDYTPGQVSVSILGGTGDDTFQVTSAGVAVDVNGGPGNDTFAGPDTPNTWKITGPGAGTMDSATFEGMENLKGGNAPDNFQFQAGGSIPGNVDGGGGGNTLNYSADGGVEAIVDLQAGTASLVGGGFANIQRLVGTGNGADTLVAPDAPTTWDVTGADAGDVNGVFSFSGVANLQGGAANDIFKFGPAGSASARWTAAAARTRSITPPTAAPRPR